MSLLQANDNSLKKPKLSNGAMDLMCNIFRLPQDRKICIDYLFSQQPKKRQVEKKYLLTYLNELILFGYIQKDRIYEEEKKIS